MYPCSKFDPVGQGLTAALYWHQMGPVHKVMPTAPPLIRNHAIVDAVEWLLVLPRTAEEELRSGTWATYRYARKKGRTPTVLILPDGAVKIER